MQADHDNTFGTNKTKNPDELTTRNGEVGAIESNENIETVHTPINDTSEERLEAITEGIRLTEITRGTALADLEKWRDNKTTDPSHYEYHLPEIQNRISRAEHSITSSKLDIDFINAAPTSLEQENAVVQKFIAGQVLEGKTLGLKNKLASFDKQEAGFKERVEKSQNATKKLQIELAEIDSEIASGGPDIERLKLNRRDVLSDINAVSDRYESIMKEKTTIDALSSERADNKLQIKLIVDKGINNDELPKLIQDDPDFAACLKAVDSYKSDDDREFNNARKYNPQESAMRLFRDRFPKKSSYYERVSKSEVVANYEVFESSSENNDRKLEAVTRKQTIDTIRSSIETGTINVKPDFEKLKKEPIIDTKSFYDVEPTRTEQGSFEYIETTKIVGRPNANNYENGWAHEYDERDGRIGLIVDQINTPENEVGIDKIFHIEDQVNDRIKLASYEGPAGPIYTVIDGTHRVAGIKASNLIKMPAEIFRTKYPHEKIAANAEEMADWQSKIDRGFITGSIKTIETKNGERSVLKVTGEILPWIRALNQNDIFKINQIYDQQYPGAIEQAGFPLETLTDITAFWSFMDGNFDQWKKLQEETELKNTTQSEASLTKESLEKRKAKVVTTAKGSIYTYLPDGRTQRYKKATETMEAPQDLLVFIPPWENISQKAKELYPEMFSNIDNATQFEQLLLEYMEKDGAKTIRPAINRQETYSLVDAPPEAVIFLNFVDKANKRVDFVLPTSREPKIGYSTFDARKFLDSTDNVVKKERHIGNKIVNIDYE